jgi:hypothetical protein
MNTSKLHKKPSELIREHAALRNMKFLNFLVFSIFVGYFSPPGSGSGSTDMNKSRSKNTDLFYGYDHTAPRPPIPYLLVILEYGNLKHEGSHQLLVEILQRNDNPAGGLVKLNNLSKK